MAKNCSTCQHPGRDCIPYLMTLPLEDVTDWCRKRKQALGLSNEDIAERTGIPVGTVKRIMGERAYDCHFSTMQPIILLLSGCSDDDADCSRASMTDAALEAKATAQEDTIRRLEEENRRKFDYINAMQDKATVDIERAKREEAESIAYLKGQMRNRLIMIYILAAALAASLIVIIVALVIDKSNQSIGFFWLKSLLLDSGADGKGLISRIITNGINT